MTGEDDVNQPLRTAVVGYGLAGSVFHAPLIASTPGLDVVGIVTANENRRAQAHRDFPKAAILSRPDEIWAHSDRYDLVVIATPNRAHVPLARASVEAGLPVVIDKPLAVSSVEGKQLIEVAERDHIPLTVFQNRRLDGDFLTVRRLIEQDMLGPLVRFESRFERYRPAPKAGAWRESGDPDEAGGLLFDLGSHLIDQAIVLFGRPHAVYAEVACRRPGVQVDDDTFVSLAFDNGIHAHLWMNVVVRLLGPRFQVSGLRGSYRVDGLDPQESALRAGSRPGDPGWGTVSPDTWGTLSTDIDGLHIDGPVETLPGRYETFYAQVRDALVRGTPLPVQPRESLLVLQVIEAAFQSARAGTVVTLP